ncbi:CU044_5270 family protein [Streptomyces hydrogenans]|uniref:CU044_5270 family protein n=1 Tax=Streptomyces hydrogenans TaxID=1873719 RepID=UPI0035DF89F7
MRGSERTAGEGHRDEELDEVRREVPDFPVPRLGEERRLERRRHLLGELGRERARRPVPRRRYAVVLGAAAAVCAILAGSVVLTRQTVPGPPPATAAAVAFLERAALAAAAEPPEPARADQYVYVRVVGHTTVLSENADGGMDRTLQREDGESWTPVDGSRPTFRREDGAGEPVEEGVGERDPADPGGPGAGSFASPTYAFAASLPSDPDALLTMLLADAVRHHGPGSGSTTGPAQQAFVAVGDLLRGAFTPPATTAALFRAAARIPGVVVLPSAVDAAGRGGVAVARVHDGERSEWIFDAATARYLGERTVLTEAGPWGGSGTVVTSVAVVGHGIVDEAGRLPRPVAGR